MNPAVTTQALLEWHLEVSQDTQKYLSGNRYLGLSLSRAYVFELNLGQGISLQ